MHFKEADSDTHKFSFFPIAAGLMMKEHFYCAIYRRFKKVITRDIETACVAYDLRADSFTFAVNPDWMLKHTIEEQGMITAHEMLHFAWMHITARAREPREIDNIACDLTINGTLRAAGYHCPKDGLFPGVRPSFETKSDDKKMKEAIAKVADLIESFPPGAASDMYFMELMKNWPEELKDQGDQYFQFDDHSTWDGEEKGDGSPSAAGSGEGKDRQKIDKQLVKARARSTLASAVAECDRNGSGWGSLPSDIVAAIREFVSPVIRWRSVLKNFVGTLVRADRTSSLKVINRRYPYIHPGTKRSRLPKLLIAVDESGSVPDDMLATFFSELSNLVKKVDIDVVPFDSHVREDALTKWHKGQKFSLNRQATGGTSFDAPTDFVNDVKRRGHYDGMLIMTDGCCSKPGTSRIKRGWVIGPGCKLNFDADNELVIAMDNYSGHGDIVR